MPRQTLYLVLFISCAHAMVHIYEMTFASVEQQVQLDLLEDCLQSSDLEMRRAVLEAVATQKSQRTPAQEQLIERYQPVHRATMKQIGLLATLWALPFGLGAVAAGWLADRFGSKRILVIYLVGCGCCSLLVALATSYYPMLVAMFLMGSLASLYHPAGLSLISRVTTARDRGVALGYHGVLGSAGIATGPFLGALLLSLFGTWRGVYAVLMLPGLILGAVLVFRMRHEEELAQHAVKIDGDQRHNFWVSFALYCVVAWLIGLTYRAFTTFLPRYLESSNWASVVFSLGIVGQYFAGRLSGRYRLEPLLAVVVLAHVPFLVWMGFAESFAPRLLAAFGLSFVLFMTQPVGNSLVAKYISVRQRSFGYGLAFLVSFGAGSIGGYFAAVLQEHGDPSRVYVYLGGLLALAALFAVALWARDHAWSQEQILTAQAAVESGALHVKD